MHHFIDEAFFRYSTWVFSQPVRSFSVKKGEHHITGHEWGSRGLAVLFLYPQGEMGVGGHCDVRATVPLRKTLNSYCTESWVGPGAGVDGCGKSCHH
jgi:hypothetical protein